MDHISSDSVTLHRAAQRPLGNNAKSASPPPKERAKRAQRYAALGTARGWLYRTAQSIDPEQHAGKIFRTHDCRYARRSEQVGVYFSALHQSAHYTKLATCGSVWACPVCAVKIQQRRRLELVQLVGWTYAQELEPQMVTLTFPHTRFDSLGDLLSKQRAAFKRLRGGKVFAAFRQRWGYAGLVRSLELTHGANGWHPHTHELWLTRRLTESEQVLFREEIIALWIKACAAVGLLDMADPQALKAFCAHSVDVRFKVKDSDYLAKQDAAREWGVDRELASSSSKLGRLKGVHPHEFLVRQGKGDSERYLEYVQGMRGARQLFWSHGLKGKVGVDEVTDEALAEQEKEPADLLGLLTAEQWRVVRGNEARAELLDAAELGGWAAVESLLGLLGCDTLSLSRNPRAQVDP